MNREPDFKPGDTIITPTGRRYVVQGPVRTSRGKLRVQSDRATTVKTTWWSPAFLPRGYTVEPGILTRLPMMEAE